MAMFDNRKAWIYSAVGHGLILAVSLLAFVVTPHATTPPDSVAIDIISTDDLAHITKGIESGKKEIKTPLAEKIDTPKKVDDAVGKVAKKEVVTETAPTPAPETPKPVEKKPDPPKQVVEKKEEKAEKKPDPPKIDPIAEALKKDDAKKPTPKQEAKAVPPPKPAPKRDATPFDSQKIAALLDKRDVSREAIAGAQINDQRALGKSTGTSMSNAATWGAMFKQQVERCWNKPYGRFDQQKMEAIFSIRLKRDGTLEAQPRTVGGTGDSIYQESAYRAIIACAPYNLPAAMYDEWKFFEPVFEDRT
jgi:colicin import membrane protein